MPARPGVDFRNRLLCIRDSLLLAFLISLRLQSALSLCLWVIVNCCLGCAFGSGPARFSLAKSPRDSRRPTLQERGGGGEGRIFVVLSFVAARSLPIYVCCLLLRRCCRARLLLLLTCIWVSSKTWPLCIRLHYWSRYSLFP
jgi:hypothetical protein